MSIRNETFTLKLEPSGSALRNGFASTWSGAEVGSAAGGVIGADIGVGVGVPEGGAGVTVGVGIGVGAGVNRDDTVGSANTAAPALTTAAAQTIHPRLPPSAIAHPPK